MASQEKVLLALILTKSKGINPSIPLTSRIYTNLTETTNYLIALPLSRSLTMHIGI